MKLITLALILLTIAACHPIVASPTLPHVAPHMSPWPSLLPTVTPTSEVTP